MHRLYAVLAATIVLGTSAITAASAPAAPGRAEKMFTDKGCIFYMFTGGPKIADVWWPFSGACTPGQPLSGKGTLTYGFARFTGTWVKGFFHGPLILEIKVKSVDDAGNATSEYQSAPAVADMGCLTSINGKPQTQPGCKEAMAKVAK